VRRSLILTVAAATAMVLLAMLVPMAVLVRSYALEDRLARAALEVQATETVVSVSGQDKGGVSVYLDRANRDEGIETTVVYPDGTVIGPATGPDPHIEQSRTSGRARVDDVEGGARILVPVSLGGSSALPENTPVIVVDVRQSGFAGAVLRTWLLLGALGVVLLAGSLFLADRLGRSFVRPIHSLAEAAQTIGEKDLDAPVPTEGPPEVQEVGSALNRLVARIKVLLERERESVADLSHRLRTPITALRLRIDTVPDPETRERLSADVDELEHAVDRVVREARRSQREGVVVGSCDATAVVGGRVVFWEPLAEEQGRELRWTGAPGPVVVGLGAAELENLLDLLLENAFSYTPEGALLHVQLTPRDGGGGLLVVEDAGPGFPEGLDVVGRGTSGHGSTGLGLDIVSRTARAAGGSLTLDRSAWGGARAEVSLGGPLSGR